MTKAELLTDLDAKSDILHIIDPNPSSVNSRGNVKWYDIPVLINMGDNFVQAASQPIIVVDEGQATEAAYYNSKKNFTEDKRAPLYSDLEVIQYIEQNNAGWTVIDLNINVQSGYDAARASVDNGTEVIQKEYRVWQDTNVEQWVQPTGSEDAYNTLGELVLHNGKVWENTHGTGNTWEPGADGIGDTIWLEVPASQIMKVKPINRTTV